MWTYIRPTNNATEPSGSQTTDLLLSSVHLPVAEPGCVHNINFACPALWPIRYVLIATPKGAPAQGTEIIARLVSLVADKTHDTFILAALIKAT